MKFDFIKSKPHIIAKSKAKITFISASVLAFSMMAFLQETQAAAEQDKTNMMGAGKYDTIFNVAEKITPEPYKIGVKATKFVTGIFFPRPDATMQMLKEIKAQLDEMDKKLDDIQLISSETYVEVKSLASDYAQNRYKSIITDLNDANTSINNKYDQFYDKGVLPRKEDDFYTFASNLCPDGTCSPSDKNIIWLLGGSVPNQSGQTNFKASEICSSNQDPAELLDCFEDNINPKRMVWGDLNNAYQDVLNKTKGDVSQNNKVAYYLAAMQPIVELELNLLLNMQELYYMNQVQVALFYAHPEFYVGKRPQFPYNVSDDTGETGYKKTLENMQSHFNTQADKFKNIFGETNDKGIHAGGLIQYRSAADYYNYITAPSGIESSRLFNQENINENCWIEAFNTPNKSTGWKTGSVSALCKVSSKEDTLKLKRTYLTFPYQVDLLNNILQVTPANIAYTNGALQGNLFTNVANVLNTSQPSTETTSAWTWVAHTSGTLPYHLMYEEYSVYLSDKSTFTKQVLNNRASKMNNSSRPADGTISPTSQTWKKWTGPKYSSHAKPDGWTSGSYTVTNNGRGYLVNSYFKKNTYAPSTGIKDKHGQLIYLSCLLNDPSCKQSDDANKLTWTAPNDAAVTSVSLTTTSKPETCPDNSSTKGGGASFKCDPSSFSVSTIAPETIIAPYKKP